jgi:UDP:flavonoid glycosyltransferase YjiC (YdhE family)
VARVAFLIYHGTGHFNACFRLARVLSAHHEIIFAGHAYFNEYVNNQGFAYFALKTVPFGLSFEDWVNQQEKKKPLWWHSLKDRWNDRLFHLRQRELTTCMQTLSPDYLLIDSWQSTDFIVLYPWLKEKKVRTAFIQTMLSTVMEPDTPPLNSDILLGNIRAIRREQRIHYWQRLRNRVLQKLRYLGRNTRTQIDKQWKENHLPEKYRDQKPSLFTISIEGFTEFILAPREFDFPSAFRSQAKHYIGFMVDDARKESNLAFIQTIEQLRRERERNGKQPPVIYCSFGTTSKDFSKVVLQFLKKLIAVTLKNEMILVISTTEEINRALQPAPAGVIIERSVPQLKLLSIANAMVGHGGLNSIKESINANVPMLLYPLNKMTDQAGNAARVVYHKLGLRGKIKHDSEEDIEKKINLLLTDVTYRENIRDMIALNDAYPEEHFIHIFDQLSPPE